MPEGVHVKLVVIFAVVGVLTLIIIKDAIDIVERVRECRNPVFYLEEVRGSVPSPLSLLFFLW